VGDRSLIATEAGIKLVRIALTGKKLTQEKLALDSNITRSTVSNFFTGKSVDRQIFVTICEELGLDWQEIVGDSIPKENKVIMGNSSSKEIEVITNKQVGASHLNAERDINLIINQGIGSNLDSSAESRDKPNISIETLVKLARERCAGDIQKRCGTMRVLDMEQPVALSDIYTDVNILEKITRNQRKELEELRAICGFADFDRWGLSGIRQKRVEGIEAVRNHRLMQRRGDSHR